MSHIKKFESFINETSDFLDNNRINGKVYHVSSQKITELKSSPMWFALEKSHSDEGWLKNTTDSGYPGYQYEATVGGKVAHISDPQIVEIFELIGEDPWDWANDVVSNPSGEEVLALKGTQALIDRGYSGIVYPDYDPRDFQKDLDALIVFNPKRDVIDFRSTDN